ncbi:hypothetical protein AB4072_11170 [Microvirga sp. 2MCAF38]|uniref:hypothetical protein n=1 Tax=Microvirga sp. 2MCAF38 TaxID=3232989 RepID=UPI003F9A3971
MWLKPLLALVFIGWAALFFTSSGLLVSSDIVPPQKAVDQAHLACRYFTGLGVIERAFWHDLNGVMGRAVCPRLVRL